MTGGSTLVTFVDRKLAIDYPIRVRGEIAPPIINTVYTLVDIPEQTDLLHSLIAVLVLQANDDVAAKNVQVYVGDTTDTALLDPIVASTSWANNTTYRVQPITSAYAVAGGIIAQSLVPTADTVVLDDYLSSHLTNIRHGIRIKVQLFSAPGTNQIIRVICYYKVHRLRVVTP